jgi:hypothetical protein
MCYKRPGQLERGYVYSFVGNAGWGSSVFFLCIHEERHKFLDGRHWNVTSVVPSEKSFAFEIQEEDCGGHDGRRKLSIKIGYVLF